MSSVAAQPTIAVTPHRSFSFSCPNLTDHHIDVVKADGIEAEALQWKHAQSSGKFDVIRASNQLIIRAGRVQIDQPHTHQITAEGWTVFTFIPDTPPPGFISDASEQTAGCVRIARSRTVPKLYSKPVAWEVINLLVRDDWLQDFASEFGEDKKLGMRLMSAAATGEQYYYLNKDLRAIGQAALSNHISGRPRMAYRAAKGFELLCETLQALHSSELVTLQPNTSLSMADVQRIMEARRFITENFASPLTLQKIGLSCGINREKLSRGFRELFNTTVIEAVVEERLLNAATDLRTSSLPISTIAYQCGYLNSASFTRAFGRRFGFSPGSFRRNGGAPTA